MVFINQSTFTFLPPSKGARPVREKELEQAQIKAHAARVSHQRRSWDKVQQQLRRQERGRQKKQGKFLRDGDVSDDAQPGEIILLLDLKEFHGSSDPFNAYPVKVTPEINRIIGYARDVMLPAIFCPPFFRRLTAGAPKVLSYERSDRIIGGSNLVFNIKTFSDMSEGAALGWLCGHIPPIMRLTSGEANQSLSTERLKMRAKSIRLLREVLNENPEGSPESLAALRLHIRTLYEAECMAGDTVAAKAHIDVLLRLEDPLTDEVARLQHLLVILFDATELACKKLERTTVQPFGQWTRQSFAPFWAMSSPFMPVPPAFIGNVHRCVTVSPVLEAMVRLRYCTWVGETPLAFTNPEERLKANMVFGWIATQTFYDIGVLINLYVDISEGKLFFGSDGLQWVQACMVLTLLYMIYTVVHEAILEDGTVLRGASPAIMPRLEQDMVTAIELMTSSERLYYQQALLWMLYAGAFYERRRRQKPTISSSPEHPWFFIALAKHAREMKINTWDQAKPILQKFVYDRNLEPEGTLWFDEVLRIQDNFARQPDE